MLHKRPRNRIKISQIKLHPFFLGLDWNKLADRKLVPPINLCLECNNNEEEKRSESNDEEAAFLNYPYHERRNKTERKVLLRD